MRTKVIDEGLDSLTQILQSNNSLALKKEVTKAIINLSLAGITPTKLFLIFFLMLLGDDIFVDKGTVKPLLSLLNLSSSDDKDGEARELAAIALENLSTSGTLLITNSVKIIDLFLITLFSKGLRES